MASTESSSLVAPSPSTEDAGLYRRLEMSSTTDHDLREVSVQRAAERFKKWAKDEYQPSTYENHCTTVNQFVAWLSGTDYALTEIDGWALGEYRDWLREQDYANVTRKQYLSQLRVFLRWASRRNVMRDGLDDKVELPDLSHDDVRSDTSIGPDRVQRILDYIDRYQRASREHTIVLPLFRTGARLGAIRGVDLSMVHLWIDGSVESDDFAHVVEGYTERCEYAPDSGKGNEPGQVITVYSPDNRQLADESDHPHNERGNPTTGAVYVAHQIPNLPTAEDATEAELIHGAICDVFKSAAV
jgi:hypothetical protein